MNDNPYAARSDLSVNKSSVPIQTDDSLLSIARGVFLVWEKLRVIYLVILSLLTISLVGFSGVFDLPLVQSIVFGAVVANVLYFAGPIVDTYIRWLGYKHSWPRWTMFVGGTLLSIVLTIGLLSIHLLPNQP
ncbi:MAG: hypothetical protein ACK5PB_11070 [Pirellula sp.]|jgi:hypothetical protein